MNLKTRDFFHRSQPQNWECAHASITWVCSLILARPVPKVWSKTHLLTNEGMLKILCLDVEVLLGNVYANSLNNAFES